MKIRPLNAYTFDEDGLAEHQNGSFKALLEKVSEGALVRQIKIEKRIIKMMSINQLECVIKNAQQELDSRK